MADYHFAQAATWPAMHAVHATFFHDYNHQKHFAHRDRPAGAQSPASVLGFVHGAWCDPADLDRLFRVRAHRRVDARGYIRFRDWRLYSERGLAGAEAAVWLLGNDLTVEHATDTLAQYRVAFEADARHFRDVTNPRLFETRYPSPQRFLDTLATVEWRPALRLPRYAARRKRAGAVAQDPLFVLEDALREPTGQTWPEPLRHVVAGSRGRREDGTATTTAAGETTTRPPCTRGDA